MIIRIIDDNELLDTSVLSEIEEKLHVMASVVNDMSFTHSLPMKALEDAFAVLSFVLFFMYITFHKDYEQKQVQKVIIQERETKDKLQKVLREEKKESDNEQIKKILIALVLVLGLFLVACGETECPECKECPEPQCNVSEVCQGLIDPATCPETECPSFDTDKECQEAGWTKECPEVVCPECPEGITAPESVEFYSEDIAVGAEVKFETEISPAKAYAGLVWFTSDPSIATVAEDGTIETIQPYY